MRELRRDLPPSCPSPARGEGISKLVNGVILKDSLHKTQANSAIPINSSHLSLDRPFPPCGGRTGRGEGASEKAKGVILTLAATALTALEISQQEAWRRQHLQNLIHYFQTGSQKLELNVLPSPTPIQPIIVGDNQTAIKWGEALKARGILVGVIRSPTVPIGQAQLQISLSAAHNEQRPAARCISKGARGL